MSIKVERLRGGEVGLECDGCGEEADVAIGAMQGVGYTRQVIFLCPQCRVKAEALLRGARKSGPRIKPASNRRDESGNLLAALDDLQKARCDFSHVCDYCAGLEREE